MSDGMSWDRLVGLINRVTRRADGIYRQTESRLLIAQQIKLFQYQKEKVQDFLARYPREPVVWRQIGLVMQEDGQWAELAALSDKLLQLFPNLAFGYRFGAVAYLHENNIDAAERIAHRAILRFPLNPDCYFTYAECADKRGDLAEALRRRRMIVHRFPESKWSYHGLLTSLLRAKSIEEGEEVYRTAAPHFPGDKDIIWTGAKIAEARGDALEAAKRWAALIDVDGLNAAAHQALINALTSAGLDADARKATEQRDFLFGEPKKG